MIIISLTVFGQTSSSSSSNSAEYHSSSACDSHLRPIVACHEWRMNLYTLPRVVYQLQIIRKDSASKLCGHSRWQLCYSLVSGLMRPDLGWLSAYSNILLYFFTVVYFEFAYEISLYRYFSWSPSPQSILLCVSNDRLGNSTFYLLWTFIVRLVVSVS